MVKERLPETELPNLALDTIELIQKNRIILLEGELGSGKTSLIKEYGRVLGIEEEMSSPTFGYVNEYSAADGTPVYHFDLYRLENSDQLMEIDFESYLEEDAIIFIEWPELALDFLEDYLLIKIDKVSDGRTYYFYESNRKG